MVLTVSLCVFACAFVCMCWLQARLEDTESRLRRLQDDKDLQMNSIISRFVSQL